MIDSMTIISKKNTAQSIYMIAKRKNVKYAIISPGSRNAPLVISFVNSKHIKTLSIIDERSAAFFAIGIAQKTKNPVILICTSGTALLNYYPALVEAFYQNIPLIIISADRPKSYLDQLKGQTIRQNNIYANYIKTFDIDEDNNHEQLLYNQRLINEAFNTSVLTKKPSHINVSFKEPLYQTTKTLINTPKIISIKKSDKKITNENLEKFVKTFDSSKNILILVGQNPYDKELNESLNNISKHRSVLILAENTSNVFGKYIINNLGRYVNQIKSIDLLITFGYNIVSKNLRSVISNIIPSKHWHIDALSNFPDTYDTLTDAIDIEPVDFLRALSSKIVFNSNGFSKDIFIQKEKIDSKLNDALKSIEYSDIKIFDYIFRSIPKNVDIHLSNSTIVRYANLFSLNFRANFFSNRGTSGIEGSMSTAVGYSYLNDDITLIITGDISFFYDINSLFNKYVSNNLRIILINNFGGAIFNTIDRVDDEKHFQEFFRTQHDLTAQNVAKMHSLKYIRVDDIDGFNKAINGFFEYSNKPILMEIITDANISAKTISYYEKTFLPIR